MLKRIFVFLIIIGFFTVAYNSIVSCESNRNHLLFVWTIEKIGTSEHPMIHSDFHIDNSQSFHLVYESKTQQGSYQLNYGKRINERWTIEPVSILNQHNAIRPSIAISNDGSPTLLTSYNGSIVLFEKDVKGWNEMVIEPSHDMYGGALFYDIDNVLHICYSMDSKPSNLVYRTYTEGSLSSGVVVTEGAHIKESEIITYNGEIVIVYIERKTLSEYIVKSAIQKNDIWKITNIDDIKGSCNNIDIAIKSDDKLLICYHEWDPYEGDYINYGQYNGKEWKIERAISGASGSIEIDSDGKTYIVYHNLTGTHIAQQNGDEWRSQKIDNIHEAPRTNVVIDGIGLPHVIYSGLKIIKYAKAVDKGVDYSYDQDDSSIIFEIKSVIIIASLCTITAIGLLLWKKRNRRKT